MSKVFFTSDLHFGHKNILKYRPTLPSYVDTIAKHDRYLIQQWNETVSDDDIVFILGDFAMGERTLTVPIARELQGSKHLIAGNHDYVWEAHPHYERYEELYEVNGLTISSNGGPRTYHLDGKTVVCSHFPWKGEGDPRHQDRYEAYMPERDVWVDKLKINPWLLHGHVHDAWWVKWPRMINVGVDVWGFAPASTDQIASIMDVVDAGQNAVALSSGTGILPS